jgi:hypothetical protein
VHYPITADMDCAAVINLQDQQSHLPPERASDQKRLYGALLWALIQGKGNQPPTKHGYAHPERFHPATKTKPARPTILRSKWDKRLWLNHVADRYASHNLTPEMIGLQTTSTPVVSSGYESKTCCHRTLSSGPRHGYHP